MSDPHDYRNESGRPVLSLSETISLMAMRPGATDPGTRPPETKQQEAEDNKNDTIKMAIAATRVTGQKCHLNTTGCIKAAKEKNPVFVTYETFALLVGSGETSYLCWRCKHHVENSD